MVGLVLLNRGTATTCVRWQGGRWWTSCIPLPSAPEWMTGASSKTWRPSPITSTFGTGSPKRPPMLQGRAVGATGGDFPRWGITRLDRELAEEAALVRSWRGDPPNTIGVNKGPKKISKTSPSLQQITPFLTKHEYSHS